jgi:hypothetical protein
MIDQVAAMDEMRAFFLAGLAVATVPDGLAEMPPKFAGKARSKPIFPATITFTSNGAFEEVAAIVPT